jgi:hypothetical protein
MLAIHSFFKNTTDIRSDIELTAKQANLSCKFLKKHKFTTILYTDRSCIDSFKYIPYDDIIILDISSIRSNIPQDFWSASKLISCSVTNEPYIHVDVDLFLIENCLAEYEDEDFFVFHNESWIKDKSYNEQLFKINQYFNYIDNNSLVYNNAIFGGKQYNIINQQINTLIDSIIINNTIIDEILFSKKPRKENDGAKSVFVEQYLFNNLVKEELKMSTIPLVLKESIDHENSRKIYALMKQYQIIHLWVHKNAINNVIGLHELMDMLEKKYF